MATITQDLGSVSAYALAVEGGYTGTEAEYKTLMANIGNTAQEIEDTIDNFTDVTVPAQVALVTAEGTEQIGLVEAEGTEQIGLVDAAGDAVIASIPADYTTLTNTVTDLSSQISAFAVTDTASGDIASFPDGADDMPIQSLVANIEPVQDTSGGDPSPSNICPITGWSSMNVTRCGKNLLPIALEDLKTLNTSGTWSDNVYTLNSVNFTVNSDLSIAVSGTPSATTVLQLLTVTPQSLNLRSDTQYTLSGCPSGGSGSKYKLDIIYTVGINSTVLMIDLGNSSTAYGEIPSETTNVQARYVLYTDVGTVSQTVYPMLEFGSSATTYEAPQVETVTIDLDGTRYGGTLDVISGVLTVDRAMVDLGTLNWTYHASGNMYADGTVPNRLVGAKAICSIYPEYNYEVGGVSVLDQDKRFAFQNTLSTRVIVRDTTYTDAATFKTAMTGQSLVYPLATPITVQLTANQIDTLLGDNNIWADTGSIASVEYPCDTKLYIAKAIAAALA